MLILLSEAKDQLRLDEDNDLDDTRITGIIAAAIEEMASWTGRAIESESYQFVLDGFPSAIQLPVTPLISITKIDYVDPYGETQTLASSKYRVDTRELFAVIHPAYNEVWPTTTGAPESVTVYYQAGYEALPNKLMLAGLLLIEDLYYDTGRAAAESLMASYRIPVVSSDA